MDELYSLIREAILRRQRVSAIYGGLPRELCPHIVGLKGDTPSCLFYQYGGESVRGLSPEGSPHNWRCLPLAGLSDVRVSDGPWFSAPNYSSRQNCVDSIDVMVPIEEGEGSVM